MVQEEGVVKLNLGCGTDVRGGYVNVDHNPLPGVVLAASEFLPFKAHAFDEVYASHVLEHVENFEWAMGEIWRVLKHGGKLVAVVPNGVHANPYHRRFFDKRAVRYLTQGGTCLDAIPGWHLVSMSLNTRSVLLARLRGWVPNLTFVLEKKAA